MMIHRFMYVYVIGHYPHDLKIEYFAKHYAA